MKKEKDTVILHRSQLRALLNLPEKDIKMILKAVEDFGIDGKEVEMPEDLQFGWELFKMALELDNRRYQKVCASRSAAGKASAAKRNANEEEDSDDKVNGTNSTNPTNATNVDFVETVSTNPTHNHNQNQNHNHNQDTLSLSEIEYLNRSAGEIVEMYPKGKVGDFERVKSVVREVIAKEAREGDCALFKVVEKVKKGVSAYASATESWEEKRFITDAVKFFSERHYNFDPAVWVKKKIPSPKPKTKFDPLDPATWGKIPGGAA